MRNPGVIFLKQKKKKKRIGNLPDYEILLNVYRISISSIKKNHDLKCLILCIKENENYLRKKKIEFGFYD